MICDLPQDPPDLVIAGEQMRSQIFLADVPLFAFMPFLRALPDALGDSPQVGEEDDFPPMESGLETRLSARRLATETFYIRDGAGIATTSGYWFTLFASRWILEDFPQSTSRWQLTGVTKDSSGAALGNCEVVILETARVVATCPSPAIAAQTLSDGSGNYAVEVPLNTAYQVIAYRPGSPDVAGVSRRDVVPTQL